MYNKFENVFITCMIVFLQFIYLQLTGMSALYLQIVVDYKWFLGFGTFMFASSLSITLLGKTSLPNLVKSNSCFLID